MEKIRAAVVGYGNIGQYVVEALEFSEDFHLVGVVRRNASDVPASLAGVKVVSSLAELEKVDVAILATPTRSVEKFALEAWSLGINTVDSFDIHAKIPQLRKKLSEIAVKAGKVSVISAGWDPGTDSMVRALLQACAPKGISYTNFGPGMSMGHSVACKAVEGVKDALSMTIPMGTGIHRRMVYVELLPGADFEKVSATIKADPYFVNDETHVTQVDSVDNLKDMGHSVNLTRKGVSGKTQNQLFEFIMHVNNPALTGQILVAAARAAMRQRPGCYTLIEIAPVDMLPGDRDNWVAHLV